MMPGDAASTSQGPRRAESGLILIVDGAEANRHALLRSLEPAGYRVLQAASGEEALRIAQQCPDLILLDVKLRDPPAEEVCARLKAGTQSGLVPVILTSAASLHGEDYLRGIESGADAVLLSPIDSSILLGTVKAWIRVRRADREREKVRAAAEEKLASEQEALRASRHELAELIRLTPVPTVVFRGPEHVYSLVNAAHDRMLGKAVEGKPIREAHTKEEAGEAPAILDRAYQTGVPFVSKEVPYTVRGEDGMPRSIWVHEWFFPFRDLSGKVAGILGVAQDVTEQVRGRQELSTVLNALPAFVTRVDPQERFVFINQSNEKYFGPPEKILGKTMREYFGEYYEIFKDKVEAALRGEAVEFEWSSPPLGDGLVHHFLVNYAPERGPDGTVRGFITCVFNIDELKIAGIKLEAAYLESNLQRARLEEERGLRERFVATLSHDLRTPLMAASMSAQLLARQTNDPVAILKLAGKVVDNMGRADQMIRDLLDANRITAGKKLPVELEAGDLSQILSETLEELSTVHGDRFLLRSGSRIAGDWSRSGIRRIVENLCNNAIKYGAAHRPITVFVVQEGDEVQLKVHNEGPPISPEDQQKLFEPFSRTQSAQIGGQRGWGLGLTLVKGIAEAHGGKVSVESSPERGTTFAVTLPWIRERPAG